MFGANEATLALQYFFIGIYSIFEEHLIDELPCFSFFADVLSRDIPMMQLLILQVPNCLSYGLNHFAYFGFAKLSDVIADGDVTQLEVETVIVNN